MSKNIRLDYLDMAKGFGMLFVLMGHLQGDTIFSLSPYFHPLCVFIFSFHMPLFFIISGILLSIKDKNAGLNEIPLKTLISKRFKGIMIPYYWFSFFYFLVVIYALINGTILHQSFFINLWYILSCYGMNVLWFLPAMFFGEIIFISLKRKLSKKSFLIIVPVISLAAYYLAHLLTLGTYDTEILKRLHEFAITLLRPVIACSWIYIGYCLHYLFTSDNFFGRIINKQDLIISNYSKENSKFSLFLSRASYVISGIILMALCAVLSRINNGVDLRSLVLRNVFFYILCSLLGSYGLILFCKGLPKIRLISFWGTGSLIFMAVHNSETILFYALKFSMFINQFLTHARGYICYLIILSIILLYTSVMIIIIQRFFPFILGKSKK